MRKQFKNNGFKKEDQIVWKNSSHEASFNPWKNYYGLINIGNKTFVKEYYGKFRNEAKEHFEEVARLNGGEVDYFGVLK